MHRTIRLVIGGGVVSALLVFFFAIQRPAPTRPPTLVVGKPPVTATPVITTAPVPLAAAVAQEPGTEPPTAVTPAAEFDTWLEQFRGAMTDAERKAAAVEGELVAAKRREWMAALIKSDPQRAIESAVPMAVRAQLPPEVTQHLEERVSGRGAYGVYVATDFEKGISDVRREFVLGERRYNAFVYGERLDNVTRNNVVLHGVAVDSLLAVAENPIRPLEVGEPIPVGAEDALCPVSVRPATTYSTPVYAEVAGHIESFCGARHLDLYGGQLAGDQGGGGDGSEPPLAQEAWSQGPKTALFMPLAFPDDPTEPITQDGAYALMDSVNQWYVENSYGTTSIIPTVTPLLMMPNPKAWYSDQGTGRLRTDAHAAARAAGYDPDNYHWDILRFTSVPGFNFGGLASVHGRGNWLQSSSVGVAVHELGHNYGIWHANYWGGVNDGVYGLGTHSEYGNSFDTMGAASAGNNQFNAALKSQLDWLPEAFVQSVSSNGTYRIYTFDIPNITPGRNYALKVKKNYDRNYWAEFRQKFTHRWFLNGVLLNWDAWNNGVDNSGSGTHLLDTTPGTPDGKTDGAVVIGRTFSDTAAGVHITPVARGSSSPENWIDLVVNVGSFPGNSPPVGSISADRLVAPVGGAINFIASATDADGDALAYYWDFNDANFGPNSPNATKSWSAVGEYTVRCTVSDMKGGIFSQHIVVTIGSPATFRVSGRITTEAGAPLEGVRVHNGLSGTSYRGTYTDSDGNYILARLAAGTHNINAAKHGYTLSRVGWSSPVNLGPNSTGRDWTAVGDPVVSIAATDATATEAGLTTGQFTISRTGPTNVALTVLLNRSGSASLTADYTNAPAVSGSPLQVVIPVGAASLDIIVKPVGDLVSEGPESLTLTLMENANYILGPAEATVTILDDDLAGLPAINVSASSPSSVADNLASESGPDHGVFTFTRTGNTANEVTVFYTVSGTATPNTDYVALPGVVVIPAGETLTALPLSVIDDLQVESNETVIVTIVANAAYSGGGDNTSLVIADDDPQAITITATDDTGRETGASPGTFTVTRQGNLSANLVVSYALSGSATPGADFAVLPGSLTIPAGRAAATITVTPVNDALVEGEETVIATILSSAAYNVGVPGSARIFLVDDEIPSVTLSASDNTATEQGPTTGAFTFTRTGSTASSLVVTYSVNGTAQNGTDFVALSGTITIPAGSATAVLTVTPINDTLGEANETVRVLLVPSPAYSVGTTAPQTVTITDDDTGLPGVGFTYAGSTGSENVTTVRLSVTLSEAATAEVTANYTVTGGSATGGGVDYTLANGTIRIPAAETVQTITITLINDAAIETNETIQITLSSPANAVLDSNATHTFTIKDDDRHGPINVTAPDASANETGPDNAVFRIARSIINTTEVVVSYQIIGGASAPSDYGDLGTSVTIPASTGFVELIVAPVDDDTDETNETVVLQILPGAHYRVGTESATVTIFDNDDGSSLPVISVVAADPLASEPGTETGAFVVSRTGDTSSDLTVQFTVGGTATSGTDFFSIGTSVLIPAGSSMATIPLTPRDDTTFESNETVVVTLTIVPAYQVGADAAAEIIIEDNETGVSVTASGSSAEDGSSTGRFTITRTGGINSDLTVNFNLAGTATRTNDYDSFGTSVVIPAGTNAVVIPVSAVDDVLPEGSETVVLTVTSGAGYTVTSPNVATVLILDDEPSVTIAATDGNAVESGGDTGLFTLTRAGKTNAALVVQVLASGTATAGTDYAEVGSTVTIPAGALSATVAITPIDDPDAEGTESVQLTILADAAYAITPPSSALVLIADDEVNLVPQVSIDSPAADQVFLSSTGAVLILEATASDDGKPNPPGALTITWTTVSGPGAVTFSDPNAPNTSARFSTNGVYVLRITATDSELTAIDQVTVGVGIEQLVSNGLRAHWQFDERTGTTAFDSSGNNRNASISGAAWGLGRFATALDFDGTDDRASFSSPAMTRLTLSAWIQSDGPGESTTPRVIAMPGYNVRIRRDTGSTANAVALESDRSTTDGEWRSPGEVVSDGPWYHIVVSYDSASTANAPSFWVNGVSQPSATRTTPVGTQGANTGTGYIGNSSAADRTWDGRLDEIRLYDRVLTANEVAILALGPATNIAPVVNAGLPQSVAVGTPFSLDGSVIDDGNPTPPGELTTEWVKISGPGEAQFTNPNDPQDTCTFSEPGIYVLRLIADDGQIKTAADVVITVVGAATVNLAGVDLLASELLAQEGTGVVTIARGGDVSSSLTVALEISGSASNGLDYVSISSDVTLPPNAASFAVVIRPVLDLVPEGTETVTVTLLPGPGYTLGNTTTATISIADRPWDIWRLDRFTSGEMNDPQVSGLVADPDGDGHRNLGEYGGNLDPKSPNSTAGIYGGLDEGWYVVTITRRKRPTDIAYAVEVSNDLAAWNTGPNYVQEINPATDDGNGVTETARYRVMSSVLSAGYRFVRLKVTLLGNDQ